MDDFELICSTAEARSYATELKTAENLYLEVVENLKTTKTQIQSNWEGDTADINDIITRIDDICTTFESSIIPGLNKLNTGVNTLADDIDKIASNTVDDQGGTASGSTSDSTDGTTKETGKNANKTNIFKKEFWTTIGNDFKDDWDYSDTTGVLSAIGNTLNGLLNSGGTVVNSLFRIVGGIFG